MATGELEPEEGSLPSGSVAWVDDGGQATGDREVTGDGRAMTETADDHRRPGALDLIAALLLFCTVALHVAAMFPAYFVGSGTQQSLAAQTDQAGLYAVLAASWGLALAIGFIGPHRTAVAASLAVGVAATELGFRVADLGDVFRYGTRTAGVGLWLMEAAWVVGAAGAVIAVLAARSRHGRGALSSEAASAEDSHERLAWTMLMIVLALVVAGAFLPAWDRVVAVSATTGQTVTRSLGNAFSGPWQQVVGTVLAAAGMLVVPVMAARVRHLAVGAAAVCGSLLVLASQLTAAVVQVDLPVPPGDIGIGAAQAQQLALHLSLKLTGWFVVDALAAYALFAAVLVRATLRVVHENSPGTRPSAPDARSASIPWGP